MSAPFPSVIRFLRPQSEQASFTPSTRATACQGAKVALVQEAHALLPVRRHLNTSSRRQASVESSLLNLDFLRPYHERGSSVLYSGFASRNPLAPFSPPQVNTKSSRYASTETRPLWKGPWKDILRKAIPALKSSNSPAPPSFVDDAGSANIGRRKIVKGANELKLRCTEFDENGNVTFMDGEFKKSELIAKVCPVN